MWHTNLIHINVNDRYMDGDNDGKVSFQDFKDFLSVASIGDGTPAMFMWNPKGDARQTALAQKSREGRVQFATGPNQVSAVSSITDRKPKFGKATRQTSSPKVKLSPEAADKINKAIARYLNAVFQMKL